MYYFLGYELFQQKLKRKALQKRAENTFLLALDGDVDFHPKAVQLLVDRMKKNHDVGAACGRIHPIGSGKRIITVLRGASDYRLYVTSKIVLPTKLYLNMLTLLNEY